MRCTALIPVYTGIGLLLGTLICFAEVRDDRWQECREAKSCVIDYDHLANWDTQPFLFYGKVVNSEHPQFGNYRRRLSDFSNVRHCLIPQERNATEPNLLKIDWKAVGVSRGAEVCVFLIATSLGSIERIVDWLDYHEFRHGGLTNYRGKNFQPNYQTEPVSQITAQWSREQYRTVKPSFFAKVTGYNLVNGFQIVLSFDQNDNLSKVGVVTPTKLN